MLMCFIHPNARAMVGQATHDAQTAIGLCADCAAEYDRGHEFVPAPITDPLTCAVLALLDASDAHMGFRQHAANIRKQYAGVATLIGRAGLES